MVDTSLTSVTSQDDFRLLLPICHGRPTVLISPPLSNVGIVICVLVNVNMDVKNVPHVTVFAWCRSDISRTTCFSCLSEPAGVRCFDVTGHPDFEGHTWQVHWGTYCQNAHFPLNGMKLLVNVMIPHVRKAASCVCLPSNLRFELILLNLARDIVAWKIPVNAWTSVALLSFQSATEFLSCRSAIILIISGPKLGLSVVIRAVASHVCPRTPPKKSSSRIVA